MKGSRKFFPVVFHLALFLATSVEAQQITATWQGQHLGTVLERIARSVESPIWLDRRVDPHQAVNANFTDRPFVDAVAELAAMHDLGVAQVDGIVYVGPKKTADGLTTLSLRARAALRQVPSAQRKLWLQSAAWSWPRLSEPRALLEDLVKQSNAELTSGELVPHDLWSAGRLPPLAPVDRVVLLLAGFDLTCEISPDGKHCRVVKIDHTLPVEDRKPPSQRPGGMHRNPPADARRQFNLRVDNQPVGRVLEQVVRQLKLEMTWDEVSLGAKNLSRETMVSCDVTNADLDGLLRGILEPAGMTFSRDGQKLEIRAAP